jgi:hypothetical protein
MDFFRPPVTKAISEYSGPQEYAGFADLFQPIGLFMFSFIKLEREISWSIASSNLKEPFEVTCFLREIAKIEGLEKRSARRISDWFRKMQSSHLVSTKLKSISQLKKQLDTLLEHRNRLAHDTSGQVRWKREQEVWSEPTYIFLTARKSGDFDTTEYSPSVILALVDDTVALRNRIRELTNELFPFAPNIVV